MQKLNWVHHLPNGNLDGGIELLNQLLWNVSSQELDGVWRVKSGEKVILTTTSQEAMEAFLYGLSLGYAVLPEEITHQIKDILSG